MSVTGHTSESSIRAYSRTRLNTKKSVTFHRHQLIHQCLNMHQHQHLTNEKNKFNLFIVFIGTRWQFLSRFIWYCIVKEVLSIARCSKTNIERQTQTFDFDVNDLISSNHDDENTQDHSTDFISTTTTINNDRTSKYSQQNKLFSMFGQQPIFNNCTFNFS